METYLFGECWLLLHINGQGNPFELLADHLKQYVDMGELEAVIQIY
jgi:hypothetical protein